MMIACSRETPKNTISDNEVELILQEFTTRRIDQHLDSSATPGDNATLMAYLTTKHGYNYDQFIEKLKIDKPDLYKKLFNKTGKLP